MIRSDLLIFLLIVVQTLTAVVIGSEVEILPDNGTECSNSTTSTESPAADGQSSTDQSLPSFVQSEPEYVPHAVAEDVMPSFDEWKRQMLKEGEQDTGNLQAGAIPPNLPATKLNVNPTAGTNVHLPPPVKLTKKRSRNYASYECGAKVVKTNPEAEGIYRMLNEQKDEYMLNPCKEKIWFVIELCEPIQITSIELANLELFSSTPKEFNVVGSDNYLAREWKALGNFVAADQRVIQSFEINQHTEFSKYIKVEMISHYGSEHYCPLSVVRVYGTSMVDEFDAMENSDRQNHDDQLNDDDLGISEELLGSEHSTQNLFGSARDAVINMMRRAAGLTKQNPDADNNKQANLTDLDKLNEIGKINNLMKLMPVLENRLQYCLGRDYDEKSNASLKFNATCIYLNSLLGNDIYMSLIEELIKNSLYRFICRKDNVDPENVTKAERNDTQKKIEFSTFDPRQDVDKSHHVIETVPDFTSVENANHSQESVTELANSTIKDISPTKTRNIEDISAKIEEKDDDKSSDLVTHSTSNSTKTESVDQSFPAVSSTQQSTSSGQTQTLPSQNTNTNSNGNNYVSNAANQGGTPTKESIFVRLSHRIKALEVNLSLSSQYLEELSQRYRKQMDEMQRSFNRTISKLNETAKKKETQQQEKINELEVKLMNIAEHVALIVDEKQSLHLEFIEIHIVLMVIEVVIVACITSCCLKRVSNQVAHYNRTATRLGINTQTPVKRPSPAVDEPHSPAKTKRIEGEILHPEHSVPILVDGLPKAKKKKKKKNATISQTGATITQADNLLAKHVPVVSNNNSSLNSIESAGILSQNSSYNKANGNNIQKAWNRTEQNGFIPFAFNTQQKKHLFKEQGDTEFTVHKPVVPTFSHPTHGLSRTTSTKSNDSRKSSSSSKSNKSFGLSIKKLLGLDKK